MAEATNFCWTFNQQQWLLHHYISIWTGLSWLACVEAYGYTDIAEALHWQSFICCCLISSFYCTIVLSNRCGIKLSLFIMRLLRMFRMLYRPLWKMNDRCHWQRVLCFLIHIFHIIPQVVRSFNVTESLETKTKQKK